jgi:hypothetical protein
MSTKSLALWAAGQAVTNPYIVPAAILMTTPLGRELVGGAIVETGRHTIRMSRMTGRALKHSAQRNFANWKASAPAQWISANPVAARVIGIAAVAGVGKVVSDQLIADAGGDVTGGFGASPSQHLVDGKPWWAETNPDPDVQAVRWLMDNHPAIPWVVRQFG